MKKSLLAFISFSLAFLLPLGGIGANKETLNDPLIIEPQRAAACTQRACLLFTKKDGNNAQSTLTEDYNSGQWTVSPVSTSTTDGYEWRDLPTATVYTLQRKTAIRHITKVSISLSRWSNSWTGTDEGGKYAAVNAKLYIGNTLVAQDTVTDDSDLDYYPYAREALQLMTNRDDICMILWSGCYDEQMAMYRSHFAEEGIRFDYANENPEVGKTSFQNFEVKLYFNVGIDDKFGFEAETDWVKVIEVLGRF